MKNPRVFSKVNEATLERLFNALEEPTAAHCLALSKSLTELLRHPDCPAEFREGVLLAVIRQCIKEIDHQLESPRYLLLR